MNKLTDILIDKVELMCDESEQNYMLIDKGHYFRLYLDNLEVWSGDIKDIFDYLKNKQI